MFFSVRHLPVIALGLTALSFATPMRRAPALEVSLSAPKTVASIGEIEVVATVKNTGSESVKVLKYGTVLDADSPTMSFHVSKNGAETAFKGVKLSLSLDHLDESSFVTIPAGETVTVTHDVSALYDFESHGTGAFTFDPITTFQVVPGDKKISDSSITPESALKVDSAKVDVTVTKDVARRELKAKRATVSCSTSSYASFISSSYSEGKSLASLAASYISSNPTSSLTSAYFGTSYSTARSVFSAVASESSSSRTLNCSDPYGACSNGVIAYTLIATTNIYFCSIFYNEKATSALCSGTSVASRNIRGGTTLHELTHATSGTTDVTYGCSADQALSTANKIKNADNYNCFATQVYYNTQC